jgi:hypothetical protein
MRTWPFILLTCAVPAACGADGAEAPPAPLPKKALLDRHGPVAAWAAMLGSEDYGERQWAVRQLLAAGSAVRPILEEQLKRTSDPEVRLRLIELLARITDTAVSGTLQQIYLETFLPSGELRESTSAVKGEVTFQDGKLTWVQTSGAGVTTQVYSYPKQELVARAKEQVIPLKWESMDSQGGYNPDSQDPKLILRKTPEGVRVLMTFTDTAGVKGTATFAPKTWEAEEDPPETQGGEEDAPLEGGEIIIPFPIPPFGDP